MRHGKPGGRLWRKLPRKGSRQNDVHAVLGMNIIIPFFMRKASPAPSAPGSAVATVICPSPRRTWLGCIVPMFCYDAYEAVRF
jgi:hypothetical protein